MGCPIQLLTYVDAWGIKEWAALGFAGLLPTYYLWDRDWYDYVAARTIGLPGRLVSILMVLLTMAGTFASWRLWRCDNWNEDPVPLALYFFMVVINAAFWPLFNKLNDVIPAIIVGAVSSGLAVAFTIFAWMSTDTYAGVVGIIISVAYIAETILAIEVRMKRNLYGEYKIIKQQAADADQKAEQVEGHLGGRHYGNTNSLTHRNQPRDSRGQYASVGAVYMPPGATPLQHMVI